MTDVVDDYAAAARWAAQLVAAVPAAAWSAPGLGVWDLRALVGHTSRALVTVLDYLPTRAAEVTVPTALDYLSALPGVDAAAVAERGVRAGRDLGDDPAARFAVLVEQAVDAVRADRLDRAIVTIAGGIRIGEYLPTRTLELVVHGLDIARALAGLAASPVGAADPVGPPAAPADPPAGSLAAAVRLAAETALRAGRGTDLLMALTGRESALGFSIT